MNEDTVTVDSNEEEAEHVQPQTLSRGYLISGILDHAADVEAFTDEAVEIAVDATLQYVVGWLNERGNVDAAEALRILGGTQ